jgi:flagellar hook-associated protein 1 FlgK
MTFPTTFGIYNAHRGLLAAQMAMNTVSHNLANANTPGYSRQRVDLAIHGSYSVPTLHAGVLSTEQVGQGVTLAGITRLRDGFLDEQFRLENGRYGLNETLLSSLNQLEAIVGEPSEQGLSAAIQKFFDAAQDLSRQPQNLASRTNFMAQAEELLTQFQQRSTQIADLRRNLVGDAATGVGNSVLSLKVNEVNQRLSEIADLNRQILSVVSAGGQPNDLYDRRDLMLDELSKRIDITVSPLHSGMVNVTVGTGTDAQLLVQGGVLHDTLEVVVNPGPTPTPDDVPALVRTVNGGDTVNDAIQTGEIAGILRLGGNTPGQATLRGMMGELNTLFSEIATQVNTLQANGRDLSGNVPTEPIFSLATGTSLAVFRYSVNNAVVADPSLIAAAADDSTATGGFAGTHDGRNALAMGQLQDTVFSSLGNATFQQFLTSRVAILGVNTQSAKNRTEVQETLVGQLDQRRSAVSGVNQDEEMIDMLRFQRAYEASSRVLRVMDEMLQTLINTV